MLWRYLFGAVAARTGDEVSGPALLLLALAVTGSPVVASSLLAGLTVSAAVGGLLLGGLLDRARRPGRMLAWCLTGYAAGLTVIAFGLGRAPEAALVGVAVLAGVLGPALTGGWTAQLPHVAGSSPRANALDSMSYNLAGLAGPALAGAIAATAGGYPALAAAVLLVLLAVPVAWRLPATHTSDRPHLAAPGVARAGERGGLAGGRPGDPPGDHASDRPGGPTGDHASDRPGGPTGDRAGDGPGVQAGGVFTAGLVAIVRSRALGRATLASMVSMAGYAMLVVSAPLLGRDLSGSTGYGALLLAVVAAAALAANAVLGDRSPERTFLLATLVTGAGMALMAAGSAWWIAVAGAVVAGAGEGPQLTALMAVRHREAPPRARAQVFTTGASLKITSFAAGSAAAGPIAATSVTWALLCGAALQLAAAALYAALSRSAPGGSRPAPG